MSDGVNKQQFTEYITYLLKYNDFIIFDNSLRTF